MASNVWAGPSSELVSITPADAAITGGPVRSIYVGITGNVAVVDMNGTTVTFQAVPAGTILPIQVARVNATNTTASGIIGLR